MRITWNENEKRFEAQFAQGENWKMDQSSASAAGFHSDGPPAWVWYTYKAATLTKLKAATSALPLQSGLSITKVALDAYNRLRAIEERDAELKKFAKEEKKRQKKEQEREKIKSQREQDSDGDAEFEPEYEPTHLYEIPEYWKDKSEITRDDLPADILARHSQREPVPEWQAEPIGRCIICGDNLYFPEEPSRCWWCEGRGEDQFFEELIV